MKKLLIPLLLLFFSCIVNVAQVTNKINLLSESYGQIKNLSEVAERVQYIPLQTSENNLIGRIMNFRVVGNRYYMSALSSEILCFDNTGKFINKLSKKGQGPEEYQLILTYDVTSDNKFLALIGNKELLIYAIGKDGFTFFRKSPSNHRVSVINFTDENNLLLQYSNSEGLNRLSRVLINIKGDTLARHNNYFRFKAKDGWVSTFTYDNVSYWYNNQLLTKELENDTVFRFNKNSFLTPYLILDSKGKGVTPEARSNGLYFSNHGVEYLHVQKIFEADRNIFISFWYLDKGGSFFFDKKTGRKYSVDNKLWIADDLSGGVNFEPKYSINGVFYSWVDALTLKKYVASDAFKTSVVKFPEKKKAIQSLADSLDETDNPVLIMVTPKK